jgi:hypothetical protein
LQRGSGWAGRARKVSTRRVSIRCSGHEKAARRRLVGFANLNC